jgi:hypothetical protein
MNRNSEQQKLRTFFKAITETQEQHARFVNTLSFLEYVGARKILKSQPEDRIDSDLLAHVAEEVRHAQMFKGMALQLSDGRLEDYALPSLWQGQRAWKYFQGIDQAGAEALEKPDPWANYLLSTYLIEQRALEAYSIYSAFIQNEAHRRKLLGIIKEEETHLHETEAELNALVYEKTSLEKLLRKESLLFWDWVAAESERPMVPPNC